MNYLVLTVQHTTCEMTSPNAVGEKRDNAHFTGLGTSTMIRGIAMAPNIVVINDAKRPALLAFLKNGVNIKDIMMMVIPYR